MNSTFSPHYIVLGIFAVAGLVALLASTFNWNWFFNSRNARSIIQGMGRKRARILYGALGLILIGLALFFYIQTRNALLNV